MKRYIHAASGLNEIPNDIRAELDRLYDYAIEFNIDPIENFFESQDSLFELDPDDRPLVYKKYGVDEFWGYLEDYIKVYHPEIYDEYVYLV